VLHGQTPVRISPRSAGFLNAGEAPPRARASGALRRRFPALVKPQPSDPRSTVQNRSSRVNQIQIPVSASTLAQKPLFFLEIKPRSIQFKRISNQALFFSLRPLAFLRLEPAVLSRRFCELDPRTKVYLRLGPRF